MAVAMVIAIACVDICHEPLHMGRENSWGKPPFHETQNKIHLLHYYKFKEP